jgi:hypothetical protein
MKELRWLASKGMRQTNRNGKPKDDEWRRRKDVLRYFFTRRSNFSGAEIQQCVCVDLFFPFNRAFAIVSSDLVRCPHVVIEVGPDEF